MFSFT